MANIKISDLPPATLPLDQANTLLETTVLEAGQEVSRRISVSNIVAVVAVPDPLLLGDGSAAAPTYSYASDPDTGIYSSFADTLEITLAGSREWLFTVGSLVADAGNGPRLMNEAATATNPTLIPSLGDPTTGIGGDPGFLELIIGSVSAMHIRKAGIDIFVEAPDTVFQADVGLASRPTYSFRFDDTTGMYSGGAGSDELKFSAGGVEALSLNELNSGVIQSHQADVAITAFAGGGQGSAVQIDESYNVLSVVATGGDSVKLPPVFAVNSIVYIKNDGANGADVFPASGDDLGAGVDTAVSVATGGSLTFIATVANSTWTQLIGNTSAAGGSVFKVGTPVDNQLGIWTGDGTLEGTDQFTLVSDLLRSGLGNGPGIRNISSTSATVASLLPRHGDPNTGISNAGDDRLGLTAGGIGGMILVEASAGVVHAFDSGLGLTAFAGGGQGSATELVSSYSVVTTVATTGDSVKLTGSNQVGSLMYVKNDGANACDVFPAVGDDLGLGVGVALSLPAGQSAAFILTISNTTWTQLIFAAGAAGGDVFKVGTPVDNQVGVWTGDGTIEGDVALTFDAGVLTSTRVRTGNGTEGLPAYSFAGETDLGFRNVGSRIGVSVAGTTEFNMEATLMWTRLGGALVNEAPSATNPTLVLVRTDLDTGIGQNAVDQVSIIGGGVELARAVAAVGANQFIAAPGVVQNNVSAPDLGLGDGDTGVMQTVDDTIALVAGANLAVRYAEASGSVIQTNNSDVALTASVTQTQAGGLPLLSSYNEVSTVGTTGDAVTAFDVFQGSRLTVVNNGANDLQLFPAVGDDFGAGVDAAITIEAGEVGVFLGRDSVNWDTLFSGSAAGGDVFKVGTPVDNEIGIWTGDGTIEGDTNFQWTGSQQIIGVTGSAAAPAIAFGDGDSGFLENTDDTIRVSLGGVSRWFWEVDSFNSELIGPAMLNLASGALIPGFVPKRNDPNTGLASGGNDILTLPVGGVEALRLAEVSSRIIQTNANHVGLTASVTQTQGGGLALLSSYNEIATVANEGDALTAFAVTEGIRLVVINNGANGLQLFPASGDDIGAGVNAAITISANSAAVFLGRDATNWDQLQNQGQNGGAVFQGLGTWRYRTEITSPPASGQVRFNNADPTLATEMFLAETNANGTDVNNFLDLLTAGSIFYIQDKAISANFFLVEISSNVDNGTDRTFGIANIILEGDEPSQNTEVLIVATESGADQLVFPEFQFFADQLENPNNADWTVNALAPASADSNNAGLTVRLFDDTTEEGVGFTIEVPAAATNIVFDFVARAETAPGVVNTVGLDIYNRGIPDNAAVQAWSAATALTDIDIPTNEFFQEDTQTVTLATLGVTAGETTQFELVRTLPGAGTDLTGDWDLLLCKVSFT